MGASTLKGCQQQFFKAKGSAAISVLIVFLSLTSDSYAAPPYTWTDSTLTSNTTIKSSHINELQANINDRRSGCGQAAWGFTPVTMGAPVNATIMQQLRLAVRDLYSNNAPALSLYPSVNVNATAGIVIQLSHIAELRAAVDNLAVPGCGAGTPYYFCTDSTTCSTANYLTQAACEAANAGKPCYPDPGGAAICAANSATDCAVQFYWCTDTATCASAGYPDAPSCAAANPGKICYPDSGSCTAAAPVDCSTFYWCTNGTTCTSGGYLDIAACELANPGKTCYANSAACTTAAPVDCLPFYWCSNPATCANNFYPTNADCVLANPGEICYPDPGSCIANAPANCAAVCGNNIIEAGELCDDGNIVSADGCSATCQVDSPLGCGNSVPNLGETCDNCSTCYSDASPGPGDIAPDPGCYGDGVEVQIEQCDGTPIDGGINVWSAPLGKNCCGCNTSNYLSASPECDLSQRIVANTDCNIDCPIGKFCHHVCKHYGSGAWNNSCTANNVQPAACTTLQYCGNTILEGTEQCDDGNTVNTDSCTNTCKNAVCGDSIIEGGVDECEPPGTPTCDASCQIIIPCGNNVREGSEQCDGSDLSGQDCQSLGYDNGTLGCTGACVFDQSGCCYNECTDDSNCGSCPYDDCVAGNNAPGCGGGCCAGSNQAYAYCDNSGACSFCSTQDGSCS